MVACITSYLGPRGVVYPCWLICRLAGAAAAGGGMRGEEAAAPEEEKRIKEFNPKFVCLSLIILPHIYKGFTKR